ncbi:putative secreted protein [Salmonella enterica subsp. enterica serovar Montevideo str. 556152]|nr:putative secreted protein [Salmonella enterica subsp. enterica serovar Montevideo str. 556152]
MVCLSLFSGAAKPVTTGIENNFRGYMMRNNNTFYTLIESDNENVWDMSVEEKGTQQNKDAVQKKNISLMLFLTMVHAEFWLVSGIRPYP